VPAELRVSDTLRIEVKRQGQYLVGPGSIHPSGAVYEEVEPWPLDVTTVPYLPKGVFGVGRPSPRGQPLAEIIPDGGRNNTLFQEGCRLRQRGLEEPEILATLTAMNQHRCHPPLPLREVQTIAEGAAKYKPAPKGIPLTEAGDAVFFALHHANDVQMDHRLLRWLVLDEASGIWLPDLDGHVTRLALATVRARQQQALKVEDSDRRKRAAGWAFKGESRARLTNMLTLAKDFEPVADAGDNWDAIPHLLGTPTGVVDLRTSVARRAEPDERITMRTNVPYDPVAHSDLWDRTLRDVFPDEAERVYVQTSLGYTATGEMNLDKWFLPHGPRGRNGKGTILGAVRAALRDYALEVDAASYEMRAAARALKLARWDSAAATSCSRATISA